MAASIPNYCSGLSLQHAKNRMKTPTLVMKKKGGWEEKFYEHYVASWACTILKKVFIGDEWIITPEKQDPSSGKRPDLTVEKTSQPSTHSPQDLESNYHLLMELKSSTGDRFEEALVQLVGEAAETLEEQIEVYVVVQRGTKIGFFEYHNDVSNLDEENIAHFRGCVSLTQDYKIQGNDTRVLLNKPNDLELLFHNYNNLRTQNEIRQEAADYNIPCVFDLDKHEQEINFLFNHMVNNPPRSSV
jgi:hypothetical protein